MLDGRDLVFLYDGSFYGLLSVVFEAYSRHVVPIGIETEENVQQTFGCDYEYVPTNAENARRVEKSVMDKISQHSLRNIYYAHLSNAPDKGLMIFNYIRAGYKFGPRLNNHLTLNCVDAVIAAARSVSNEAHLFKEFIRFAELEGGVYYSAIEPKSNVLPLIEEHFVYRYSSMPFLIHDKTHNLCLVYNGVSSTIHEAGSLPKLEFSENESEYRRLWKCFFNEVEIKERHNEKCQNTHLPKWFRKNMVEFN